MASNLSILYFFFMSNCNVFPTFELNEYFISFSFPVLD
jgi:hypothetical protein